MRLGQHQSGKPRTSRAALDRTVCVVSSTALCEQSLGGENRTRSVPELQQVCQTCAPQGSSPACSATVTEPARPFPVCGIPEIGPFGQSIRPGLFGPIARYDAAISFTFKSHDAVVVKSRTGHAIVARRTRSVLRQEDSLAILLCDSRTEINRAGCRSNAGAQRSYQPCVCKLRFRSSHRDDSAVVSFRFHLRDSLQNLVSRSTTAFRFRSTFRLGNLRIRKRLGIITDSISQFLVHDSMDSPDCRLLRLLCRNNKLNHL